MEEFQMFIIEFLLKDTLRGDGVALIAAPTVGRAAELLEEEGIYKFQKKYEITRLQPIAGATYLGFATVINEFIHVLDE